MTALGDKTRSRPYTVGSGQPYFKPEGEEFFYMLGNTPEFGLSQDISDLKHMSTRSGQHKVDAVAILSQELSGSFSLDEFVADNLRFFFMGSETVTDIQGAGTGLTTTITNATRGSVHDLGYRNIAVTSVVAVGGSPTYTNEVDYEWFSAGQIYICPNSSINGENIVVTFNVTATSLKKIHAASSTSIKGHFLFVGDPLKGKKMIVQGYGTLKPSGDLGMITDDWMGMPFGIEFEENAAYTGVIDVTLFGTVT